MFKKSYSKKDFEKLAEGMKTAYEQRIRQLEERVDRLNVENKNLRAACAEYQSREKRVGQAIVDAEEKGSEIKELYRLNAECELRCKCLRKNGSGSPRRWRTACLRAKARNTRRSQIISPPF